MIKSILFWCVLPFTLPQAIFLRKTATRLPDATGNKAGQIGNGEPLNLIGLGDSVIVGVGVSTLEQSLVVQTAKHIAQKNQRKVLWHIAGKNGASSHYLRHQIIPNLPTIKTDIFLISIGVNDVTALTSIAHWQENLNWLLSSLQKHSPNALIIMSGVPPMASFPLLPQPLKTLLGFRASLLDHAAQQVTQESRNTIYIPLNVDVHPENLASDGFHPSALACSLLANVIAEEASKYSPLTDN